MTVEVMAVSLPSQLVERIDRERDDISRSKYVLRLLEEAFQQREKDKTGKNNKK